MKIRGLGGWLIVCCLLAFGAPSGRSAAEASDETNAFRPQFHFTPERNFMNDPNGLVFFEGRYHLFFQHNPFENKWGHMSWGHAVSRDLVHWRRRQVAIPEGEGWMIFSGSAVVDWRDTTKFAGASAKRPPLVAIYTSHRDGRQAQSLAYSLDGGDSWAKYSGNPVLDIGKADFRDPKVFWHEPARKWIMVVALSPEHKIQFYAAPDLIHWSLLGSFGPEGATNGVWECPDLFQLTAPDGGKKWILSVNLGDGAPAGGSGGQYFIGNFDGNTFSNANAPGVKLWHDYGKDFYAAVSYNDVPPRDGRRVWIGWMNNWQYAEKTPTSPWRSAQAFPRELALRNAPDGLRLIQHPVKELALLRSASLSMKDVDLPEGETPLPSKDGVVFEGDALFDPGTSREFGWKVRASDREWTTIGYDVAARQLFVDRTSSGDTGFSDRFSGRHSGPLPPKGGKIRIHILVDRSSVEVFGNDGETVITEQIFPLLSSDRRFLYSKGGQAKAIKIGAWGLKSIWR
jgi:fructan beta-fructosidase